MNTSQIYTRFQRLLQETSSRFFNTAWAVELINDSVEDIFDEIRTLNPEMVGMVQYQLGYITGQREYNLPSGNVQIDKVEVTDLGGPPFPRLDPITFFQVGDSIVPFPTLPQLSAGGQGEPTSFYVRQPEPSSGVNVIGFDPIPFRTATNNINVWYITLPTPITGIDTEIPDLPLNLHRIIPLRMCVLAAMADSSPKQGGYEAVYQRGLERALLWANKGTQGSRERIRVEDG